MNNQTENYIILKPIADKFNDVAKQITDDEIKNIIKEQLVSKIKEELEHISFGFEIQEIAEKHISENSFDIENMIAKSIENKFK